MYKAVRRSVLAVLMILGSVFFLSADSSGELAYSLYSPLFLGGGTHTTGMETPQAVSINPAAAGNFQRIILDVNYINLQQWDSGFQGMGHAANTALSFPSKYGVFTGAFHFVSTNRFESTALDFGTFGSLDAAFSKELYKDLFVGFGVTGALGTGMDWGAALNLGFIHDAGTLGKFRNFRWGGSLKNLGRGYGTGYRNSYMKAVPENITLNLGAGFDLVEKENFKWSLTGDVGVPTFTDLRVELGQEILIQERLRIATSSSLILSDAIEGNYRTLIPSVGIYYNYKFKGKDRERTEKQTSEIEFQGGFAPLYDGIMAVGAGATIPFGVRDSDPPAITVDYGDHLYISPNLNGIQDELDVPFQVEDERYVMGYYLKILNEEGDVVREFRNKDERPENESFKNIFARLFSEKTGTAVPETFRWDGIMDSGEKAPDGVYSFVMEFWDDNDNRSGTEPFPFTIDTTPPEITIEKQEGLDLIFSPDGDGNKDTLSIRQTGSAEDLWEAAILDLAGNPIRTYIWENDSPAPFEWDGKDNAGAIVPDGVYSYIIHSTDPGGNYAEETLMDILVNTEQPPVNLTIDNSYLSPGNPEGIDTLRFGTDIPVTSGILEWELRVLDASGRLFWNFHSRQEGVLEVPETITYKGELSAGGFLREGRYQGYLTVRYQNGYEPEVYSPWFLVDTTVPVGSVRGDKIFSPDGDGFKDSLTLDLETTEEDYWEGFIRNESNETVKSWFWRGKADPQIVWDGRDNQGKPVEDGRYYMVLEAVDKAGNRGVSNPHTFQMDTREMSVQVSVNEDAFSPNGNGIKDQVVFYLVIDNPEELESWELTVYPSDKGEPVASDAVRTWTGSRPPASDPVWKGKRDDGSASDDGYYMAVLSAVYAKGDRPAARTTTFLKDTVAPELKVSITDMLFSPDGDGNKDSVRISQSSSRESDFEAVILDSAGETVRTWFWKDQLEGFDWDGRDENGNVVPDGSYTYRVSVTDAAGNNSSETLRGIQVDTAPTPIYLTARNTLFSPISEEFPSQEFTAHVTNNTGIDRWNLRVVNQEGQAVRSIQGRGAVPAEIVWDGRDDGGSLTEGTFRGTLEVRYAKGNRPVAESRDFTVDNSAPMLQVGLSPLPFSPDDDNVDDELKIAIAVKDLSPIRDWEMVVRDPRGNEFISFGGKGRPSERIIWDGRSRQGELVQSAEDYPYELIVTDLLGHAAVETGVIPVDILVVRDGPNLKVRISNINFEPYRSELVSAGEQGDKNRDVLKRLSEVLKKYGSYKIVIEGHAVSEFYDNPARAAKEEKEELQPLSLDRAAAVREYLVSLGIQASRMDVVGRGGTQPVVPHSDLDNRWKNRRVEFILIK